MIQGENKHWIGRYAQNADYRNGAAPPQLEQSLQRNAARHEAV